MSALRQNLRMLGCALALFAVTWWLVARLRGAPEPATTLVLRVRDDGGGPLAEVQVLASGFRARADAGASTRVLGTTDAQGTLRRPLDPSFQAQHIQVRCPEAYRPAQAQAFDAHVASAALSFVCRPKLRTIAVVVHAPSARGFVLRADAQSLGRVDDQGVLHAVLRRPPGSTLSLALEPGAQGQGGAAGMRRLVVEDRDRIVLFDPRERSR